MREAFIQTEFVRQLVATAGHYQVFGLMIWLLSLCGNCWCETRVSMRNVSMM